MRRQQAYRTDPEPPRARKLEPSGLEGVFLFLVTVVVWSLILAAVYAVVVLGTAAAS